MGETEVNQPGVVHISYGFVSNNSYFLIHPSGSPSSHSWVPNFFSGEMLIDQTNVAQVGNVLMNFLSDDPSLFPTRVKGEGVRGLEDVPIIDETSKMYRVSGRDAANRLFALGPEGVGEFRKAVKVRS